jgi:FkbM family methyltransferase
MYTMSSCIFKNDDNVSVLLLENHPLSGQLAGRDNHEICFRQINTFLIKKNIIKNNIIDLGAWIGDNTIPWAKNINGIVYAIDPSPENCSFIKQTGELNQIKNVKVIQSAISDKNEILSTSDNLNHCSFVYCSANGENKVSAVSLDYLHDLKVIENIGYIHLDVEGMEYRVVQGAEKIIDTYRPVVSFEQHITIDNYAIILSYFKNKYYRVFLVDEIMPGCWPDCRNSFAFPMEIYTDELIAQINTLIGRNIMIPM